MLRLPSSVAKFALTCLTLGLLTGCGIFGTSRPSTDNRDQLSRNPPNSANSQEATSSVVPLVPGHSEHRPHFSSIEIEWLVPAVPVDGFVISYGFGDEPLTNRVTVPISELKQIEDHERGPIYRYFLNEIPRNREIRVAISSYLRTSISEPSPTQVVPINEQTVISKKQDL
jgi:hypothetical protein